MRRAEDIGYINKYRPDYAGFILSDGFRRSISYDTFRVLVGGLDGGIKKVGVFVDEPLDRLLEKYTDKLDVIQLHGNEDKAYAAKLRENFSGEIWKAVRASCKEDIEKACTLGCDKLVIDSCVAGKVGGTGLTADWDMIAAARPDIDFFLAGGLDSKNISRAVKRVRPFGVDLSSSVETDGVKDEAKIREIIEIIRNIRRI